MWSTIGMLASDTKGSWKPSATQLDDSNNDRIQVSNHFSSTLGPAKQGRLGFAGAVKDPEIKETAVSMLKDA
ncbi:hypothetical protein TgHK011_004961 [Trichoderma gracile]|nr:hypothetical protein TgHK011_004961 [Trichoderma gracile]